jgi:glycosyltransferase involved in cell wall biosynthesis
LFSSKVTTVVPAYSAAHTIGRALSSIFAQTCPPAEVLVVDDGSPDDLASALRPYGERVTLLRKPNGGAASARNMALDRATGDLVAFLDADDYWEPYKLERQLALLRAHPEVGLTCSRWFTQIPGQPRVSPAACTSTDFDRVITATGSCAFSVVTKMWTSTVLVHRKVLGTKRFTSGLEPAEDRDLWVRLVAAAPVYLDSEPLATYVQEPNSLCRSNVDRDYGNMLRVIQRHTDWLGEQSARSWETATLRRWAARHLGSGHPRAAFRPAWKRLLREPFSLEGWWVFLKTSLLAGTSLPGLRRVPEGS